MNYFEQRFQQIYEKFLFSLKIYHTNPAHCETCYRDCLNEMDSLFLRHDTHDQFAKELLNLGIKNFRLGCLKFFYCVNWFYS